MTHEDLDRQAHATGPRYAARATAVAPSTDAPHPTDAIMFASGDAYPESLPDLSEFAHRAAVMYRTETLQYAPRFGLAELREWIAGHAAQDGIRVDAASILVLHGAKQGIDLVAKLFLDPGDAIVVTRPTYQSALGVFRAWQPEFVEVGLDREGMLVDELAVTLARARREALVALAARYGMRILEDDPYRRIRFAGEPVPPIQAFDTGGHVIGLGTFAKLVAPGLRGRLAYSYASPSEIVEGVRRLGLAFKQI